MGGSWFVALDMELTPASHCLVRCSYVWSVSVYDLFPVTMVGGTLFIPPRGGHMNVQYIAETIAKETIDAVVIQPTLLNLLLDEQAGSPGFGNFGMIIAPFLSPWFLFAGPHMLNDALLLYVDPPKKRAPFLGPGIWVAGHRRVTYGAR